MLFVLLKHIEIWAAMCRDSITVLISRWSFSYTDVSVVVGTCVVV
ncbi:MAG: hypothetical protein ACKERG_01825 [Candidatus Hodgkinia cicadicola]